MARRRIPVEKVLQQVMESSTDSESDKSFVLDEEEVIAFDNFEEEIEEAEAAVPNVAERQWHRQPFMQGRREAAKVVLRVEGQFKPSIHPEDPVEAFMYFMLDGIIDFVHYTTLEARRVSARPNCFADIKEKWCPVDVQEMEVFVV